jgi:hypothetical protein
LGVTTQVMHAIVWTGTQNCHSSWQ